MYAGTVSVCLRVEDLQASVQFYEALGFSEVPGGMDGQSAVMHRGSARLFLMNFGVDSLNFRGADAFEVRAHLERSGVAAPGMAERQDDGGTQWLTEDPDGHVLFFNTHAREMTAAHRQGEVARILAAAVQDLSDVGADSDCIEALRGVADAYSELKF